MTSSEYIAQDQEAIDMVHNARKGIKTELSPGCLRTVIGGHRVNPEMNQEETEFDDYPIPEYHSVPDSDWMKKLKSIIRNVVPFGALSILFFWGVLSGNVTGEMGWPLSWGCSLVAMFLTGAIVFKK